MNIAVYNHKGGCGKSTLTAHLGFYAFEKSIDSIIIDTDRQYCSMSWLSKHNWSGDESYQLGTVYVTNSDVDYNNNKFIIYDTPPGFDVISNLSNRIDKWIVPVDGRFSVEGAMAVIDEIGKLDNNPDIYIVVNKGLNGTFGRKERKEIEKLNLQVFCFEIPQADVIRKAETFGIPSWQVPYGNRSLATQNIRLFCKWVFEGFNQKQLV